MIFFPMLAFFVAFFLITSLSLPIPHKTEKIVSREPLAGNGEAESRVGPHSAPAEVFARGVNRGEGGSTQNPARSNTGPGELPYHSTTQVEYRNDDEHYRVHAAQLRRPDGTLQLYIQRRIKDGLPHSTALIRAAPNGTITRITQHYFERGEPFVTYDHRGDGHTVNQTGQGFTFLYENDNLNGRRSRFGVMLDGKLVIHLTPVDPRNETPVYTPITDGYERDIPASQRPSRPPTNPDPNGHSWIMELKDLHGQIGPIPVHHLDAYELAQKNAARYDSQAH